MPSRVSSRVGSETPPPDGTRSFAQAASSSARIGIAARRLIVMTSMPEPYLGVTLGRLGWFLESVAGAVAQPGQSRGLLTLVSRVRILPAPLSDHAAHRSGTHGSIRKTVPLSWKPIQACPSSAEI